jgi:hypothetical protein
LPVHFDETLIPLNRVRFALVPRGRVGRESIILPFNATRLDMSAKGHSRHFDGLPMTSGLPPETDIVTAGRHVSKVPIGDIPRGGYALIVRYALRLPKSSFVIDGETVVLRRAGRLGADAERAKIRLGRFTTDGLCLHVSVLGSIVLQFKQHLLSQLMTAGEPL